MFAKRHLTPLLLLVLAALFLAACGAGTVTQDEVAADNHDEAVEYNEEDTEHDAVEHGDEVAEHDDEAAEHHDETAEHHDEKAADGHDQDVHVEEQKEDHAHTQTSHEAIDGAKEVRVVATEWAFEPESIHLHEGEAVNIVLVNDGLVEHEVEFAAFDFHVHAQPGETVTAGFVPDETGEFEFGCFVPGHYQAGMHGDLVVEHAH